MSKFCTNCGAPIQAAPGATSVFCTNCGTRNEIESEPVFVTNSQPSVPAPTFESPVNPEPTYLYQTPVNPEPTPTYQAPFNPDSAPTYQPPYQQANPAPTYPPYAPTEPETTQKPPKKKAPVGAIVGGAVALVLVIAAIVFFAVIKPSLYITNIKFEEKTQLIEVDGKYTVEYTVEPANYKFDTIEWKSSDKDVAKVDDSGVITATGEGTCTITAKSEKNGKKATIKVIVQILPKSVELDDSSIELEIGDYTNLDWDIEPYDVTDDTVTFTSSDEDVATVDDYGKVTAVDEGTCTITVTTVNGITDECTVKVTMSEEDRAIIGTWYSDEEYDRDTDTTYDVSGDNSIIINKDHTATLKFSSGTTRTYTWEYIGLDDGDYEYKFTGSDGKYVTVYFMNSGSLEGMIILSFSDGLISFAK